MAALVGVAEGRLDAADALDAVVVPKVLVVQQQQQGIGLECHKSSLLLAGDLGARPTRNMASSAGRREQLSPAGRCSAALQGGCRAAHCVPKDVQERLQRLQPPHQGLRAHSLCQWRVEQEPCRAGGEAAAVPCWRRSSTARGPLLSCWPGAAAAAGAAGAPCVAAARRRAPSPAQRSAAQHSLQHSPPGSPTSSQAAAPGGAGSVRA